jgi:hypothetical protein
MKIDFDAFLTWHKNDYNYINILPRMTVFVSPIFDNEVKDEPDGRIYGLQIGWLCFEVSISVERRTK